MSSVFRVILQGSQETPPNNSTASGAGTVIFDSEAVAASYSFDIQGLDFGPATGGPPQTPATDDNVTRTHFHTQVAGVAGPIVFGQIDLIRLWCKTPTILKLCLMLIDGNFFGGVQDGAGNMFSTANWTTGVWSDGSSVGLTITDNTFDFVRTDLNLDGYNDATTNVSLNSFVESGSGISIGTPSGSVVTGIRDNTFDVVAGDFNLLNVTTSQSLDLDATSNVSVSSTDAMVVLGGTASDTLTGSAGVDLLAGGAGDDTLIGGVGNDTLIGGETGETQGDKAVYNAAIDATGISDTGSGWTVTSDTEGTDTLTEIEIVDGTESGKFLLVGNGGFTTI